MDRPRFEPLNLNPEELGILSELLESHRDKLLTEIRRTDHRAFRDDLRRRLGTVGRLLDRCHDAYLVE